MKISEIIDAVGDAIVARKCFIVEINVSKDNDVEIVIESEDSNVAAGLRNASTGRLRTIR